MFVYPVSQLSQMSGVLQEVHPSDAHASQLAVLLLSAQPWLSHSRQVVASLHLSQCGEHLRNEGGGGGDSALFRCPQEAEVACTAPPSSSSPSLMPTFCTLRPQGSNHSCRPGQRRPQGCTHCGRRCRTGCKPGVCVCVGGGGGGGEEAGAGSSLQARRPRYASTAIAHRHTLWGPLLGPPTHQLSSLQGWQDPSGITPCAGEQQRQQRWEAANRQQRQTASSHSRLNSRMAVARHSHHASGAEGTGSGETFALHAVLLRAARQAHAGSRAARGSGRRAVRAGQDSSTDTLQVDGGCRRAPACCSAARARAGVQWQAAPRLAYQALHLPDLVA